MFHSARRISTISAGSWHWCPWKTARSAELWTKRCSFRSLCTKVGTSTSIAAMKNSTSTNRGVFFFKPTNFLPSFPSHPSRGWGHWRANCSYAGLDPAATNQLCRWFERGSKCPTKICSAVSCVMPWPRQGRPNPPGGEPSVVGGAGWLGCPQLGLGKSPWAELLELEVFEFANSGDSASARHTSTFSESGIFWGKISFGVEIFLEQKLRFGCVFLNSQNTHQKQKKDTGKVFNSLMRSILLQEKKNQVHKLKSKKWFLDIHYWTLQKKLSSNFSWVARRSQWKPDSDRKRCSDMNRTDLLVHTLARFVGPIFLGGGAFEQGWNIPSRKLTYPTLAKGKSSTQNWLFSKYISSQDADKICLKTPVATKIQIPSPICVCVFLFLEKKDIYHISLK